MKYRFALLEIQWDDATANSDWQHPSSINPVPEIAVTVGFLVKETDGHIVIASTDGGEASGVTASMQIPKKMIISRRTLARARKV